MSLYLYWLDFVIIDENTKHDKSKDTYEALHMLINNGDVGS